MTSFATSLLDRCLCTKSPGKTILVASLGCFLGSFLVIFAIQIYADSRNLLIEERGDFVTLNKRVKGGLLQNLDQNGKRFESREIINIGKLPGVLDTGEFSRNLFPLRINIWPAGKIGLGAAARADLFFESLPDRFLDYQSEEWQWDENKSFVPIMVPKFYLDLWNFGLAPSRSEYPALSLESASSMPIEIFIGENQSARMLGRFVAFSKRINSVLVPQNFLQWANSKYAHPSNEQHFFVWDEGEIKTPPVSLSDLKKLPGNLGKEIQVSAIGLPEKKLNLVDVLRNTESKSGPARLMLKIENSLADTFFDEIEKLDYETSREQPQVDWINRTAQTITYGVAGLGALLSLLSMATFTSCFRLMVMQAAKTGCNLIHLGFSPRIITRVFKVQFDKIFGSILVLSVASVYTTRIIVKELAMDYGFELAGSLGWETWSGTILYGIFFLWINHFVIHQTVYSFTLSKNA